MLVLGTSIVYIITGTIPMFRILKLSDLIIGTSNTTGINEAHLTSVVKVSKVLCDAPDEILEYRHK